MSSRIFIFGTGSHARKIFHYAIDLGWTVVSFVDEAIDAVAPVDGFGVIAAKNLSVPQHGDSIFVGVGNPNVRARLMDKFALEGWRLPSLVHRAAWIAPDAVLGEGVLVAAGAVVETSANVARGTIVDIGVLIDHDAQVAEFSHLRPGQICGPHQVWPLK